LIPDRPAGAGSAPPSTTGSSVSWPAGWACCGSGAPAGRPSPARPAWTPARPAAASRLPPRTLSRRGENPTPLSHGTGEFTMDYAEPPYDREPVTTIAWRLAHLIDIFGSPAAPHFTEDRPAVTFPGTAAEALRQLDEGHDAWIKDVRGLGAAGLAQPQGTLSPPEYANAPMARLVMYNHMEIIHHGAEVCLLRDLYLWRENW